LFSFQKGGDPVPFKSEKQRKFMWAKHPGIAQRWSDETSKRIKGKKMNWLKRMRAK
jgi:hypothetical protein